MSQGFLSPGNALSLLWSLAGQEKQALENITITNSAVQLPSVYNVGGLACAAIGAQALAAAEIWRQRTGQSQQIGVDMRRALAMFRADRYMKVNGQAMGEYRSPLFGYYPTADGRWIQLHTNFPQHASGVVQLLGCGQTRDDVAKAISHWNAAELDAALAARGLCAAFIRTLDEWNAHPQAAAVAALPLFEITRVSDADPRPIGHAQDPAAPLSGVRVLDLSRVIAAPVAGRTLAQHGADVLAIGADHLPNIMPLVIDTGRGKRSAQLDLRTPDGKASLQHLIDDADVFLQAYRPDALSSLGFSAEQMFQRRPGLVYVTLSAYGHMGPWSNRRGFDSLVQSATGIAWDEGREAGLAHPGKLPCQALDYATGFITAFATMVALQRRAREGGSWRVRVSLAQTARWLKSLGRDPRRLNDAELTGAEIAPWLVEQESAFGTVTGVAPVEAMSKTPPRFRLPPVPLGTHKASWS